ncbi:DNA replication/repair protein RecF [Patescibacteria group bacterium]|nr:DNA replication/repair protein RecF [Patescibacteria group bacterium]MBU1703368.1 DNA replication/repair protein RecF [Patescibacteria group bacterium]MBU1954073.1 DNA replication/repair protein RecF [Patescibacteria group bacterium]
MRLQSLKLEKYRNYETLNMNFKDEENITTIIGPNAQGKTNILEAIYLLALTKSFRAAAQNELIRWGDEYCRVTGRFTEADGAKELEIFLGNPPQPVRSLKINGVKTGSINFIGNCQIVFFHPEDLNMLYLGPDLRRRYLDILNVQVNPAYYAALRAYRRILKQRNSLLKSIKEGIAQRQDLDIWDQQLAAQGEILISQRRATGQYLSKEISEVYSRISQNKDNVEVIYRPSLDGHETLAQALKNSREKDINAQFTTVGPHRDDLEFRLNGRPLAAHASRGEYRSLLLAVKLLELNYYEEKTGEKPILLLDDVFSELDQTRQRMLLNSIKGYQTIITATHLEENVPGAQIGISEY